MIPVRDSRQVQVWAIPVTHIFRSGRITLVHQGGRGTEAARLEHLNET
jgi:hypothetical protein